MASEGIVKSSQRSAEKRSWQEGKYKVLRSMLYCGWHSMHTLWHHMQSGNVCDEEEVALFSSLASCFAQRNTRSPSAFESGHVCGRQKQRGTWISSYLCRSLWGCCSNVCTAKICTGLVSQYLKHHAIPSTNTTLFPKVNSPTSMITCFIMLR